MAQQKHSTLAIAALIFSLIFFIPLFSIIGIIAGIAGVVQISKNKNLKGKGLAIAAIIIGVIVTILQIILVLAIYGFFSGIIAGVKTGDISKSVDNCINQKSGFNKDMCIFMTISVNINQTENIDKNLCDANVETIEIRNLCNAILKKDKTYCYNITSGESRIKCLGLVDEINRKANKE